MAALQHIIVHQPESAGEKLALAVGHTIDIGVLRVPRYKATLHEMCFDGFNSSDYARIIRIFISLGIEKIRLTGGEPLLRKGLVELVEELGSLRLAFDDNPDSKPDLALTTN